MSIISVDFMSLYQQTERLKRLKYDIYEEIDRVEGIMHILDNMQIGDTVDELKNIIRELEDSADEIEIDIKKLQKILGIYEDCEKVCEKAVDELPIALFRDTTSFGGVLSGSGDVPKSSISGKFYSHSVINDDWLNELIF